MSNRLVRLAWQYMPRHLSAPARLVYVYFCDAARDRYKQHAWVTLAELMRACNMSKSAALRHLAELRAAELVLRLSQHGAHGVTMYQVYAPAWADAEPDDAEPDDAEEVPDMRREEVPDMRREEVPDMRREDYQVSDMRPQVSDMRPQVSDMRPATLSIPNDTQLLPMHTRARVKRPASDDEPVELARIPEGLRGGDLTAALAWARSSYSAAYLDPGGPKVRGGARRREHRPADVTAAYCAWYVAVGLPVDRLTLRSTAYAR